MTEDSIKQSLNNNNKQIDNDKLFFYLNLLEDDGYIEIIEKDDSHTNTYCRITMDGIRKYSNLKLPTSFE